MKSFQYAGRTALIIGASARIGVAYARGLATRGADLVVVARRTDATVHRSTDPTTTAQAIRRAATAALRATTR